MDEKTNFSSGSKRTLILISLGVAILALASTAWVASQYETRPVEKAPTTSKQPVATKSSSPVELPTQIENNEYPFSSEAKTTGTVISPGESAEVQCGKGSDGVNPQLDSSSNLKYTTVGGGKRTMTVYVLDKDFKRANGARLKWTFGDWGFGGSLDIDGCSATFTPPNSLGTAYNTNVHIYVKAVLPAPPPSKPVSPGEGGPTFAGYVLEKSILVYDSSNGGSTSCYDPAGVAISINSVSTVSSVQIVVDTPRFTGRTYNGRNATVRDGPGTYYIDIYVNGSLYDSTTSQVGQRQLSTVKW